MVDMELTVNRINTTAFIAVRPTIVVMTPSSRQKVPGGGFKTVDGTPRAPQKVRIIELGMQSTPPTIRTTDGVEREANFWVLGEYNALIRPGDHWTAADGREWEIGDVVRDNGYEVRALATERGK